MKGSLTITLKYLLQVSSTQNYKKKQKINI